jgi:hypothetical protein
LGAAGVLLLPILTFDFAAALGTTPRIAGGVLGAAAVGGFAAAAAAGLILSVGGGLALTGAAAAAFAA